MVDVKNKLGARLLKMYHPFRKYEIRLSLAKISLCRCTVDDEQSRSRNLYLTTFSKKVKKPRLPQIFLLVVNGHAHDLLFAQNSVNSCGEIYTVTTTTAH